MGYDIDPYQVDFGAHWPQVDLFVNSALRQGLLVVEVDYSESDDLGVFSNPTITRSHRPLRLNIRESTAEERRQGIQMIVHTSEERGS